MNFSHLGNDFVSYLEKNNVQTTLSDTLLKMQQDYVQRLHDEKPLRADAVSYYTYLLPGDPDIANPESVKIEHEALQKELQRQRNRLSYLGEVQSYEGIINQVCEKLPKKFELEMMDQVEWKEGDEVIKIQFELAGEATLRFNDEEMSTQERASIEMEKMGFQSEEVKGSRKEITLWFQYDEFSKQSIKRIDIVNYQKGKISSLGRSTRISSH